MSDPASPASRRLPMAAVGHHAAPDWWLMLRKFMEQGTGIASFAPSSRFLSRALLKGIDYDRANCIVELGAGTGPVTEQLVKRVKSHTRLIVLERDPDFCTRLRAKFPTAEIVEGDAAHIDTLLADRGISHVDHMISGLPLPSFPADLRNAIISTSARVLGQEGYFRQLTVMPLVYKKLYKGYFDEVKFRFVPINLPPAGVYVCRGFRQAATVVA